MTLDQVHLESWIGKGQCCVCVSVCVCVCFRSALTDSASWQDGSGSMAAVLFNVSCSQPQLLQMRVNIAGGPFHSGLALSHTLSVSSSPYDTGWEDTSLPLSPSLHLWETVKESVCPLRSGLGDRVSVNVVLQRKNKNKNRPWKYADCWHRLLCIYWSASEPCWFTGQQLNQFWLHMLIHMKVKHTV